MIKLKFIAYKIKLRNSNFKEKIKIFLNGNKQLIKDEKAEKVFFCF